MVIKPFCLVKNRVDPLRGTDFGKVNRLLRG